MFEVTPRDRNSPEQKDQAWYIARIVEAVENDDASQILRELKLAWLSGYEITGSPVRIREKGLEELDKKTNSATLYDILWNYFNNLIEKHRLSPEERISLYRIFREYDSSLAEIFIQNRDDPNAYSGEYEGPQSFEKSILNPEELYAVQCEHYEYLIDKLKDLTFLEMSLRNDGHLDHSAPYEIPIKTRKKILNFVAKYLNSEEEYISSVAKDIFDVFEVKE